MYFAQTILRVQNYEKFLNCASDFTIFIKIAENLDMSKKNCTFAAAKVRA